MTLAAVLGAGCLPRGHATDDGAFVRDDLPPPEIDDISVSCDIDAGRWRVEVGTTAWSGGAAVLWTSDGVYFERHDRFSSIGAAGDGLGDKLRNDIVIISDFRPSGNGVSTFTCNTAPSAFITVKALDGEVSDCRNVGEHPELVALSPKAPECPDAFLIEPEDTDAAP